MDPTSNRVMRVCKWLRESNQWAIVYMDNRFSKPLLFSYLFKDLRLYATGTWRSNYGVPNLIAITASKRVKDIDAAKEAGVKKAWCDVNGVRVVAFSQYDNAPFYMLSTAEYSFEMEEGGTKDVLQLDIVHDYNNCASYCQASVRIDR